jgi:hypothetical protein
MQTGSNMAKARKTRSRGTGTGNEPQKKQQRPMNWSGAAARPNKRNNIILGGVVAAVLAVAIFYLWNDSKTEQAFLVLAERGKPALAQVQAIPSRGGGHLAPGQNLTYPSRFPTSGMHDPVPIAPGFYDIELPPTQLVHSVEHGHIVIYYDDPGPQAISHLRDWTSFYVGHWDGVVAVPTSGLGPRVVLTAWARRLNLDAFDPSAVAAFIDAFRGRGPENPVR